MLSRVFRIGTTLVVLGLMTASAHAQGGGRGGPGGGRGFPRGGTASDLLSLLSAAEVRKEVGLSEEGGQAVDKLLKEADEARAAMFGGRGPGGPGGGGPGGPPGGEQTDEQRAEREQRMKEMRDRMAETQKKAEEAVMGVLSDSQKKALEELKGKKFEFPESLRTGGMMGRGFGFGGGGGRGPGGGGAPGGAPGGGGRGPGGGGGFDFEKMQAQREEAAKKAQELLDEVLPPEGLDRLIGLYVQLRGAGSITGELPAKKLGLSEDDVAKINEANMNVMREAFGGGGGGGGRQGRNRPSTESGT